MTEAPQQPPVLDYDGDGDYLYRRDFWEQGGRAYEDQAERVALKRLLPPSGGRRLLELGAGFGRLSPFLIEQGYQQVILLDYSREQLLDARSRLGDKHFIYVAADIYRLPIAGGACDAASMIRVIHHFADVPAALQQIHAALADGSPFILEYANKRNLKAMLRYALRRQDWNPYSLEPIEFVKLHYDFHPRYMDAELARAGFETKRRLAVSYFRLGLLKRLIPTPILTALDSALQPSAPLYSPSVFTLNRVGGVAPASLPEKLFKCPSCGGHDLPTEAEALACVGCGARWSKADGVYDFRQPL